MAIVIKQDGSNNSFNQLAAEFSHWKRLKCMAISAGFWWETVRRWIEKTDMRTSRQRGNEAV